MARQDLLEIPLTQGLDPLRDFLAKLPTIDEGVAHRPYNPTPADGFERLRRIDDAAPVGAKVESQQGVPLPTDLHQAVVAQRLARVLFLLRSAHELTGVTPVRESHEVDNEVAAGPPQVSQLGAVQHCWRFLGHIDHGVRADQRFRALVEEGALRRTVREAQPVPRAEEALLDLRSPRRLRIAVLELARGEDSEEGAGQVDGPRPLLRHCKHLGIRPASGEGAHEDLVLVLRAAKDNELHREAELSQQGDAFLGGGHWVVDPQASALQADRGHPDIHFDVRKALLLLKCPDAVAHLGPDSATMQQRPQGKREAGEVDVGAATAGRQRRLARGSNGGHPRLLPGLAAPAAGPGRSCGDPCRERASQSAEGGGGGDRGCYGRRRYCQHLAVDGGAGQRPPCRHNEGPRRSQARRCGMAHHCWASAPSPPRRRAKR
mmetsp:Transcript_69693/g.154216  ORF Transcript_69693/g.154216 Transcript_69693/m.154216 type:complete len:433 (+) Transcript_69693:240-1538(+)